MGKWFSRGGRGEEMIVCSGEHEGPPKFSEEDDKLLEEAGIEGVVYKATGFSNVYMKDALDLADTIINLKSDYQSGKIINPDPQLGYQMQLAQEIQNFKIKYDGHFKG